MEFRTKGSDGDAKVDDWLVKVDEFMVIGIDFGTTYSGAAWATVAEFEDGRINLITSWPGTEREEGKAPTELFYEDGRLMWGYTIPLDADPIRCFKLLLHEDDLPPGIRESEILLRARKRIRESQKTAIDLIADYLGALWRHILDTINRARQPVIEALKFHVVITVPAIWKDYARQSMEKAAEKSGILAPRRAGPTTLALASEPEAAALASLDDKRPSINVGDVFVICDAGGGTVDLISYKVRKTAPIELHEAVIGTGGPYGGVFIDEAFESMCKSRLGCRWNKLTQNGIKEIMKNEWEYAIKPQFKLDNSEYIVAVPAEAFEGSSLNDDSKEPIKGGRIHFTSTDVQKAFVNTLQGIESLVDEQISKIKENRLRVTGIILVGGLGSSPYLYEHLKRRYGHVLQSTGIRPRTSICRGAVFKGFMDRLSVEPDGKRVFKLERQVSVISAIARVSLGVMYTVRFIEGVHREEDRFWDHDKGDFRVPCQMMWYLRKGDNVSKMEPKKEKFSSYYSTKQEFESAQEMTIFQCEDDDPPSQRTDSDKVKELCNINYNFNIPYDSLENFTGASGKKLKRLVLEIEMMPSGASNEFSIIYQGNKLGSQNVHVDFQSASRASSGHFGVSPGRSLPEPVWPELRSRKVREK